MSQMTVAPEFIGVAAADVAAVGSSLDAAHLIAAVPTVAVLPAAADEVSGAIANLFSQHARSYQTLAGQAAAFNNQFVQHLNASMHAYAAAETANAASLAGAAPAASSGTTNPLKGIQDSITTVTNQILNLLHGIAVFPYELTYLLYNAQFAGLVSLIVLQEFAIYLSYQVVVPPFAWPFPLGNPVVIPLIP